MGLVVVDYVIIHVSHVMDLLIQTAKHVMLDLKSTQENAREILLINQ